MDELIRAIEATLFASAEPLTVDELAAHVGEGPDVALGYAVSLRFINGAAGSLAITSFTNAFSSRFTLHGSAGASLEIADAEALRLLARAALPGGRGGYVDQNLAEWRQGWSYAGHLRPGYMEELVAFARAIREGFPASASLDDAAAALRICVAILESSRSGRSVALTAARG